MYVKILRDALMYQNGCFSHIVERGGGGQTHVKIYSQNIFKKRICFVTWGRPFPSYDNMQSYFFFSFSQQLSSCLLKDVKGGVFISTRWSQHLTLILIQYTCAVPLSMLSSSTSVFNHHHDTIDTPPKMATPHLGKWVRSDKWNSVFELLYLFVICLRSAMYNSICVKPVYNFKGLLSVYIYCHIFWELQLHCLFIVY